jgi:hypothetical protein
MVRIGNGGYFGLREDAGRDVLRDGVDYLFFDFVSEGTVAQSKRMLENGKTGYYWRGFKRYLDACLPLANEHGTTLITNAGAADPVSAGEQAVEIASGLNVPLEVIVVTGDDFTEAISENVGEYGIDPERIISAYAYLGASEIVEALDRSTGDGVTLVLGGRFADPSMVVGALAYEFEWDLNDWEMIGQATLIGHFLENDAQVTGGYYMEPERKPVPDPHMVGYPIAEVDSSGRAVITKAAGAGGYVNRMVMREQMFYEIHDPSAYLTPDVSADFTTATLTEVGDDRVEVIGGTGTKRPDDVKILIGLEEGFHVERYRAYGGFNAEALARLGGRIVRDRIFDVRGIDEDDVDLRVDLVGVDSLYRSVTVCLPKEPHEVLLRIAARTRSKEVADIVGREALMMSPLGPAGGATNHSGVVKETIGVESAFLPREQVRDALEYTRMTTGGDQ